MSFPTGRSCGGLGLPVLPQRPCNNSLWAREALGTERGLFLFLVFALWCRQTPAGESRPGARKLDLGWTKYRPGILFVQALSVYGIHVFSREACSAVDVAQIARFNDQRTQVCFFMCFEIRFVVKVFRRATVC